MLSQAIEALKMTLQRFALVSSCIMKSARSKGQIGRERKLPERAGEARIGCVRFARGRFFNSASYFLLDALDRSQWPPSASPKSTPPSRRRCARSPRASPPRPASPSAMHPRATMVMMARVTAHPLLSPFVSRLAPRSPLLLVRIYICQIKDKKLNFRNSFADRCAPAPFDAHLGRSP